MAEEPQAVPAPQDEPQDLDKKAKTPNPKFGQVLDVGGQFWTVQSSENGEVLVSKRMGDVVDTRKLSEEEFARALKQPLPKNLRNTKPPKGIRVGSFMDLPGGKTGRILGFDAVSGEVQIDTDQGASWISPKATSPRPRKRTGTSREEAATPETGNLIDRFVRRQTSDIGLRRRRTTKATPAASDNAKTASAETKPSFDASVSTSTQPSTQPNISIPVDSTPAASSASSIRETRKELKAEIERVKRGPRPTAPSAVLGVAKAALDAIPAEPPADAKRAQAQQQLYARAMHALDVVSSRAADKRKTVQELQAQAETLRQNISRLNTQTAPSAGTPASYRTQDIPGQIQSLSSELGGVQNRLAMARYGLQTDEAQAQQLQISTNLMRNVAPEVQQGQVPDSIVQLVTQSIPSDVPPPSPNRVAALMATLSPSAARSTESNQPALRETEVSRVADAQPRRSFAPTLPSERAHSAASPPQETVFAENVRRRMQGAGLSLPQATAVALSAGQQADRGAGNGYQEALGSPDAREAAFAQAGAGARPVISTIPQSYSDAESLPDTEDTFRPGGEAQSEEFAREQQRLLEAQEQFLPGTTGGPQPTTFEPEAERQQRVRDGSEGRQDEEALRAAKYASDVARARAAALQAFEVNDEEERVSTAKRAQRIRGQLESSRRNISRMIDLFNAALGAATAATLIGALIEFGALLLNMNGRLLVALVTSKKRNSVIRKIFPPAQFPIEAAFIASMDVLVLGFLFINFCVLVLPFIILLVMAGLGISGVLLAAFAATS